MIKITICKLVQVIKISICKLVLFNKVKIKVIWESLQCYSKIFFEEYLVTFNVKKGKIYTVLNAETN